MYIESKIQLTGGEGRIGRVTFSKTGQTVYYAGRTFERIQGYKSNHVDKETGVEFWISGCKKDGSDALYPLTVEIDADIQEKYWKEIRSDPAKVGTLRFQSLGKYRRG